MNTMTPQERARTVVLFLEQMDALPGGATSEYVVRELTRGIVAAITTERARCARIARRHHLDLDDPDKYSFCSCGKSIATAIEWEE